MKLLTGLQDGKLMVDDLFIDHQNIEWFQALQVSHDAVVAHALMQAMDDYGGDNTPDVYIDKYWIQCLRKRADAIASEWGFDSEGATE